MTEDQAALEQGGKVSGSVWVIEQGSYNDYRVVGVFTSRKNAEAVCAKINEGSPHYRGTAGVAEWPLDPGVNALSQGLKCFHVLMLRDGTIESVRPYDDAWAWAEISDDIMVWPRSQAPAFEGKGVADCLQATVWATDEGHAIKIVNERRVQMIANSEWT